MAWCVLVRFLAAIGTLIFVILMNLGLNAAWSWLDISDTEAFSGTWQILATLTAVGLIVGLLHHFLRAEEVNVYEAIQKGRLEPETGPASLLVSLVLLIRGYSIGPEAPPGMLAGGLGTWINRKQGS